jgi:phosphatidylglycerol---prolipoprotein diacylglyceryl transferase
MAYPTLSDLLRGLFGIDVWLPMPMFGLMVGIAFFVGLKLATREAVRLLPDQPGEIMSNGCLWAFLGGIVGARLFHILEYPREFLEHPMEMLLSRSGFTIFGGLIAGSIAGALYVRSKRAPIPVMMDACAPGLMLAYAIGRIGCQISGDGDWGIEANLAAKPDWLPLWFWAQTYTGNIAGVVIDAPGVYPTPLYEVVMATIAFAILWKLRKHHHRAGWLFTVYILLAGVERLLIEFIRVNTTYDLFGHAVTQAQLISVACIVLGALGMYLLSRPRAAAPTGTPV